jgi:hypothetical protein
VIRVRYLSFQIIVPSSIKLKIKKKSIPVGDHGLEDTHEDVRGESSLVGLVKQNNLKQKDSSVRP